MVATRRLLAALLFLLGLVRADPSPRPFKYPFFKSTWSLDPSEGFFDLPRTARELRDEGKWMQVSNCADKFDAGFPGDRYVETPASDDTDDIVLIFDGAGFIAGIQLVTPWDLTFEDRYHNFTSSRYYHEGELLGREVYFFTVYFVDPSIICQGGRAEWQFERQGTLHRLHVQTGPTPDNLISVPVTHEGMKNEPGFFKQRCFPTMGTHYSRTDASLPTHHEESCDIAPFFNPIYNNGHMNAVTLGTWAPVTGKRLEEATARALFSTFEDPPRCAIEAAKTPGIRTMHVFFDDYRTDCSDGKNVILRRG